jgi:hypothetical protein
VQRGTLIDFWVKNFFSSFLLKMIGNGQKSINIDVLSGFDHVLVFITALNVIKLTYEDKLFNN